MRPPLTSICISATMLILLLCVNASPGVHDTTSSRCLHVYPNSSTEVITQCPLLTLKLIPTCDTNFIEDYVHADRADWQSVLRFFHAQLVCGFSEFELTKPAASKSRQCTAKVDFVLRRRSDLHYRIETSFTCAYARLTNRTPHFNFRDDANETLSLSPGELLHFSWDYRLVALSYLCSVFGSWMSLLLVEEAVEMEQHRNARKFVPWLIAAAVPLGGCAIWSMHFIGMAAAMLPIPMYYHVGITVASILPPILCGIAGFYILLRRADIRVHSELLPTDELPVHDIPPPQPHLLHRCKSVDWRLFIAAGLLGLGVCSMHYLGTTGMLMSARVHYHPGWVILSVIIAVTASGVALFISVYFPQIWLRFAGSFVMGLAVCGMHYTGMHAMEIYYDPNVPNPAGFGASSSDMTLTTGFVALFVCFVLLGLHMNHHKNAQDYTKRAMKRAQQEADAAKRSEIEVLQAARKKADQANQSTSDFMSYLCHELRNPLHAIIATLEFLSQSHSQRSVEENEHLDTIKSSSAMMSALLNDVLDMAKISAGKMLFEEISFDLRALLDSLLRPLQLVNTKGIKIQSVVDASVPEYLVGDPMRMRQVISNLLTNAMKFTNRGFIQVSVSTATTAALKRPELKLSSIPATAVDLEIHVRDSGIGMDDSRMSKLFDPFEQTITSIAREYGGTGLGLSIVRGIVEMLGGHVSVSSVPDVGTEFVVYLRFAKVTATKPRMAASVAIGESSSSSLVREFDTKPLIAAAPQQPTIPTADRKESQLMKNCILPPLIPIGNIAASASSAKSVPKILVVDDSEINRRILKQMLNGICQVSTADNGLEAIQAVSHGATKFDMVLMDIVMPVMDGVEATQKLREAGITIPIIAITANSMIHERQRYFEAGMNGFVSKPYNRADILSVVSSITDGISTTINPKSVTDSSLTTAAAQ